jgi:CBS domain containing-hemolysin-like protein
MSGDTHIDEVERAVGRDLPQGDYETVAGLVLSELGALPEVGAVVDVDLEPDPADLGTDDAPGSWVLRVEVIEVARRVPSLVRVRLLETAETTDEAKR